METHNLALFQGKGIRRVWYKNEWFYSVIDIIEILTESPSPRQYWGVLKQREAQLLTICLQLKLPSRDGKKYATDCVNTKNTFRLIQSIPSKKAEPFKQWLAQVGKERLDEINDPELAQERMKALYKQKGYPKDWIDKRLRGIAIRQNLTDEWKQRGAEEQRDFEILTAEIAKATFGITPFEHKKIKGLQRENLRDHMDDFELIFTMLGEKSTTEIHRVNNTQGVSKLQHDAKAGGKIAGDARKALEKQIGKQVVTKKNFLTTGKKKLGEVNK